MKTELHADRLVVLRDLEGITQAELAKTIGVTSAALTHVINGDRPFPEAWAHAASSAYQVPTEFFSVTPSLADEGVLTYKKKASARVREERRINRLYDEAARLFRYASEKSRYRTAALPDPSDFDDDPELVAAAIRQSVGLGPTDPVLNVARLCERLGVGVVDRLDPSPQVDARHSGVSRPSHFADRPLIAVASDLSPGLKRFVIAHELYHLIADRDLDRPLTSTRDPRELRAHRFAGALLLPREVASTRLTRTLTLHGYLRVKADYGIEVKGLIHRAKDLRIITPDREKSLYIQWSSNGWRDNEPVAVPDERPLLLAQALRRADGRNYAARVSHTIGVPAALISHWTRRAEESEARRAEVVSLADRVRSREQRSTSDKSLRLS